MWWIISWVLFLESQGLELPDSCGIEQYYDPGLLRCLSCASNASMVKSDDGFSCACNEHSILAGGQCMPCAVTEVVSTDGAACVPRKCQHVAGRVACRKCPQDYISVTQNLDGSPTKEVQCIKCARGFKPSNNACVRCDACICNKSHVVVRGTCVPRVFVNGRPKYSDKMHPLELLDVVKHEYLCTKNYSQMCRLLAEECVKNFYISDPGGPCRLWLQPKSAPAGLPALLANESDKHPGEMSATRKGVISIGVAIFNQNGVKFLEHEKSKDTCQLPISFTIGLNFSNNCKLNLTAIKLSALNTTLSPFLIVDGVFKLLPVKIKKPSGYYVQKSSWPNNKFSRYFVVHNYLSIISNATNTIYLRALILRLLIDKNNRASGELRLRITIEVQYANTVHDDVVDTTLTVEHLLPNADIVRGLEICGSVVGILLALYSVVQWRGIVRRGGLYYCILPLLAGAVADTLYISAFVATLHALAAETGSLGIALPLSRAEDRMIKAFVYSALGLKLLKVVWLTWKQCSCDVFFLDWAQYNTPTTKGDSTINSDSWKLSTLAREWSRMQTIRRASPGFTVTGTMLLLHVLPPWLAILPSTAYTWAVASTAWWCSYVIVLVATWAAHRFVTSHIAALPRVCSEVGISLLVFEEEFYAHYVHGRIDDSKEARSMSGPLATCRIACVPQLRAVYKQLSSRAGILGESESRHALLSKFLAAFFERALDGLHWVASERTIPEKLVGVELSSREAGTTSVLLYDDDPTASVFAMTWWGQEWNLCTFDAMVFSCVMISTGDAVLSAIVTVLIWQVLKQIRTWLGNRNQVEKTHVDINFRGN